MPPCPVTEIALILESVGPSGMSVRSTHSTRRRLADGGLVRESLLETTALVSCNKGGWGCKREQESRNAGLTHQKVNFDSG